MNYIDIVGFIGVALILLAYFLNLSNRLLVNDLKYILMNLIGAMLACLASMLMKYYPFVLLEGTWTIVSFVALINYLKKNNATIGITDLNLLIKNMEPVLNEGEYVYVSLNNLDTIPREITICEIKEKEGTTIVVSKTDAEKFELSFEYIAAWITLNIHSSLAAVGLTAAFATELSKYNISCNVIAGYYHDHIFVDKKDEDNAIRVLMNMTKNKSKKQFIYKNRYT